MNTVELDARLRRGGDPEALLLGEILLGGVGAMIVAEPSLRLMFITMSSSSGMRLSASGASALRKAPTILPPSTSAQRVIASRQFPRKKK